VDTDGVSVADVVDAVRVAASHQLRSGSGHVSVVPVGMAHHLPARSDLTPGPRLVRELASPVWGLSPLMCEGLGSLFHPSRSSGRREKPGQGAGVELGENFGDVPVDLEGAGFAELVLAEPAGLDGHAADTRGAGGLDVPDAVTDG
jgi:hypothetical protein